MISENLSLQIAALESIHNLLALVIFGKQWIDSCVQVRHRKSSHRTRRTEKATTSNSDDQTATNLVELPSNFSKHITTQMQHAGFTFTSYGNTDSCYLKHTRLMFVAWRMQHVILALRLCSLLGDRRELDYVFRFLMIRKDVNSWCNVTESTTTSTTRSSPCRSFTMRLEFLPKARNYEPSLQKAPVRLQDLQQRCGHS